MNIQQFKEAESKRKKLAADTLRRQRSRQKQARQREKHLQLQREQALAEHKNRVRNPTPNRSYSSSASKPADSTSYSKCPSAKKWGKPSEKTDPKPQQCETVINKTENYEVEGDMFDKEQQQQKDVHEKEEEWFGTPTIKEFDYQQGNKFYNFHDQHAQREKKDVRKVDQKKVLPVVLDIEDSLDGGKKMLKDSEVELQRILGLNMNSVSTIKEKRTWLDDFLNETPAMQLKLAQIKQQLTNQKGTMQLQQINQILNQNSNSLHPECTFVDSLDNPPAKAQQAFNRLEMPIDESVELVQEERRLPQRPKSRHQKHDRPEKHRSPELSRRKQSKERLMKQYDKKRKHETKPKQKKLEQKPPQALEDKDILEDSLFSNPIKPACYEASPSKAEEYCSGVKSKQSFVSIKTKKKLSKVNEILSKQENENRGYAGRMRKDVVTESQLERSLQRLDKELQAKRK